MSYTAITFSDDEVVYRRGEDGDCMFIVQEGAVERLGGGEDGTRLALFERGDFFGETAVLDKVKRGHTMRVTEQARLIKVDAGGLAHMLKRNPEITVRMLRKLAQRLTRTEQRLCSTLAGSDSLDETLGSLPQAAQLIFDSAVGESLVFDVRGEGAAIGRTDPISGIEPDVDLTAIDPQLTTSRRHAAITIENGSFNLVEMRATNGTFVNGKRLRPEQPARLLGGEQLMFGAVALRFELVA